MEEMAGSLRVYPKIVCEWVNEGNTFTDLVKSSGRF